MIKNKKSMASIIVIILLIMVTILSVVYFQKWFKTYQSTIQSNLKGFDLKAISLPYLGNGLLYITNNNKNKNATFTNIIINGVKCNLNGTILPKRTLAVNVSACLKNTSSSLVKKVFVLTPEGTIIKTMIERSVKFISNENESNSSNPSSPSSGILVGYAYGENFGYVSFNGTNYSVILSNNKFTGYAYSENLGYISFNGTNYNVTLVGNKLVGYAYGENFGYLSFNGTNYSVVINNGYLQGEAYSETEGYLYFNYSTTYNVSIS